MKQVIKINFFTMYKILRKIFKKDFKAETVRLNNRYLLSVAINNYGRPSANLRGCINDQANICKLFSDYIAYTLKNSEATKANFKQKLQTLINIADEGDQIVLHYSGHGTQIVDNNSDEADGYDEALYLYDGALLDDELSSILSSAKKGVEILVLLDSCFSGTATRNFTRLQKFISMDGTEMAVRRKKLLRQPDMEWTVLSGCRENQTSADAYIDNDYHGAFSYYLCQCAKPGQSVRDWFNKLQKTSVIHYQNPTFEGVGGNQIFY